MNQPPPAPPGPPQGPPRPWPEPPVGPAPPKRAWEWWQYLLLAFGILFGLGVLGVVVLFGLILAVCSGK